MNNQNNSKATWSNFNEKNHEKENILFTDLPILSNEVIKLKPITKQGQKEFYEYSSQSKFYEYLEYDMSKTEYEEYFLKMLKYVENNERFYWFIIKKDEEKIIGTFGLRNFDILRKSVEISYGLSPKFWNKGFFKNSLQLVLNYLFLERKFHRIFATTQSNNIPSILGLKRLGFIQEGILRDSFVKNGKWYNNTILSILENEYKK